jgi:3-dehydroquinate dehydratase II
VGHRLFVLNGPNLNRLGRREPHVYGQVTLAEIEQRCQQVARELDFDLFFAQSNAEAQLIDWLHRADDEVAAVIINPAGLSFRSVAIHDALRTVRQPTVEVHLTNIFGREPVYHRSLTSAAVSGLIAGLGAIGYELAMRGIARNLADDAGIPSMGP